MAVDLARIASAAAEALLGEDEPRRADRQSERPRRLRGVGALALGIGLGVAARGAYRRARGIDLERVAGSIEDKLKG